MYRLLLFVFSFELNGCMEKFECLCGPFSISYFQIHFTYYFRLKRMLGSWVSWVKPQPAHRVFRVKKARRSRKSQNPQPLKSSSWGLKKLCLSGHRKLSPSKYIFFVILSLFCCCSEVASFLYFEQISITWWRSSELMGWCKIDITPVHGVMSLSY